MENTSAISYLEFGSIDIKHADKKYGDIGKARQHMIFICLQDMREIYLLFAVF